jgi:hypothetical protein
MPQIRVCSHCKKVLQVGEVHEHRGTESYKKDPSRLPFGLDEIYDPKKKPRFDKDGLNKRIRFRKIR